MRALALALALAAAPAAAEERLDAAAFEALAQGRTLFFTRDGAPYGAEQYLPGRRVIWQYADGSCSEGVWFAAEGALCFLYEHAERPQCWIFARRGEARFARRPGQPAGTPGELRLSRITETPLVCGAPGLGA